MKAVVLFWVLRGGRICSELYIWNQPDVQATNLCARSMLLGRQSFAPYQIVVSVFLSVFPISPLNVPTISSFKPT